MFTMRASGGRAGRRGPILDRDGGMDGHDLWTEYPHRYVRGELATDESAAFEVHLEHCARCRADVVAERAPGRPVPDRPATPLPPPSHRSPSSAAWLVSAAALVTALGAAGLYVRERSERLRADERIAAADSVSGEEEGRIAQLDSMATAHDSLLTLLFAEDVRMAELTGAPEGGSARIFWSPLRARVVLSVHGLRRAPPGRTYQLWSISGRTLIGLGRFDGGGDQPVLRTFELVPGTSLDRVLITEEPMEGADRPAGPALLTGRIVVPAR